ncbi:hypothetical protein KKE34_04500 [Patescibacteria group bacterium]|nr:hypothetical protein [Patescibacteria group bacterium]
MKSRFIVLLSIFTVMMMVAPQALALEIKVDNQGVVRFYDNSVLGRNTNSANPSLISKPNSQVRPIQNMPDSQVRSIQNMPDSQVRPIQNMPDSQAKPIQNMPDSQARPIQNMPDSQARPIRTIPAYEDKQIYLRPDSNETTVEIRKLPSTTDRVIEGRKNFQPTEVMKADYVEMSFPAQLTEDQIKVAKEKRAEIRKDQEEKIKNHGEKPQEIQNQLKEQQQIREKYLQKLQETRKERHQETVEVKSRTESGENILGLKSRHTTALLKNGAEFQLNPTTNEVTVTTPSGQEHTLNHLPDQAIERMEAAGFFTEDGSVEKEIEVKTYDNGELFYRKQDKIKKRLFGVIPVQVDSEVILNDATGEVIEKELAPDSLFKQFINAVSF